VKNKTSATGGAGIVFAVSSASAAALFGILAVLASESWDRLCPTICQDTIGMTN
jgi:hypothetical protein